jgi:chromosome segregation ATPase
LNAQGLEKRESTLCDELARLREEISRISSAILAPASDITALISDRLALQDRQGRLERQLSDVRFRMVAAKSGRNLLEGYVETVVSKARVVDGKVVAVDPSEFATVKTSTVETSEGGQE